MNYSKNDIDSLTTKEFNAILKSNFLKFYNQKIYYEDMTKYANLGAWVLNSLGADIDNIEDLIGKYPKLEEGNKKVLNNEDYEIIKLAKKLGLSYEITSRGVRLGN